MIPKFTLRTRGAINNLLQGTLRLSRGAGFTRRRLNHLSRRIVRLEPNPSCITVTKLPGSQALPSICAAAHQWLGQGPLTTCSVPASSLTASSSLSPYIAEHALTNRATESSHRGRNWIGSAQIQGERSSRVRVQVWRASSGTLPRAQLGAQHEAVS